MVSRPSRWGSPYRFAEYLEWWDRAQIPTLLVSDFRHGCIERTFITPMPDYPAVEEIQAVLRGHHDLACWCPLEDADGNRVPCHADVLLELANPGWTP